MVLAQSLSGGCFHSRCWLVLHSSESLTGTGECASKLVHSPTRYQDASLSLDMWSPASGGLRVLTTRQLASYRVSHSRGSKMEVSIFSYYLTLEVTHQNHFFKVLAVTQAISIHCRRGVCLPRCEYQEVEYHWVYLRSWQP